MIKAVEYNLEYQSNIQETYQNYVDLPGFVLLESTDKNRGRYDILSAYPYKQFKIEANEEDIESCIHEFSEQFFTADTQSNLPFQGGAIGYITYDLGARLQNIHSIPQKSLAQCYLLDMGFYDWAIIVDHYEQRVTLYCGNRDEATREIAQEILKLWCQPSRRRKSFAIQGSFVPLISKDEYQSAFHSIMDALMSGRSYQVNFTQPFHAPYHGDTWEMYRKISRQNPVPYSAYMKTSRADILSFSPEQFMSHDKGRLTSSPIKGTIGRSKIVQDDNALKHQLEHSVKDRAENVMIVDLLRNDLAKICKPGSVEVTHLCRLESYNSVHHLVSEIIGESESHSHLFKQFISCFPGGSITGAPKLESMRIIKELEAYSRGVYCGSIAYFSNHGRFDSNIAIRTITARNDILHLAAGGGIVIDSSCETEYQECYMKIAAIINGLNN